MDLAKKVLEIETRLSEELSRLDFGSSVTHVYNPLDYAIEPHGNFVRKYCSSNKDVLFVGMNPGPFGMAQTGVNILICDHHYLSFNVHDPTS